MYEKFDGDLVLQTPVLDVLNYFQSHGCPEIDTHVYHHSARNLFLKSPFRDERTASFSVMTDSNCWKDFGSGEGGGVLDLVCRLSRLPRTEAFILLAEISKVPRSYVNEVPKKSEWKNKTPKSVIHVTNVLSCFTDEPLVRYAASRGIQRELLDRYCYQISYYSENYPSVAHTNIGFPNIGGGYAYRGPGRHDKGCTLGRPTFIDNTGKFSVEPKVDTVVAFEGFFDFLSYMQYNHDRAVSGEAAVTGDKLRCWMEFVPYSDVVVLNSVNNLHFALDFLSRHKVVNCCFDNDDRGRACYRQTRDALSESDVLDRSFVYAPCNDFNEFLMNLKTEKIKSLSIK